MSLSIAVVGAGQHASKIHLPILKRLQDEGKCTLSYIIDLNKPVADLAAKNFGFSFSDSTPQKAFLDPTIDAIYIFGDPKLHVDMGMEALKHGKHVFVEKPAAPDLSTFDQFIEAQKKYKKTVLVGFNRRYMKPINIVRDSIKRIGPPQMIEASFHNSLFDLSPKFGVSSWFIYNSIHIVDVALNLLENNLPKEAYSLVGGFVAKEPKVFSSILHFKDTQIIFTSSNSAGGRFEEYKIHWPQKTLIFDREHLTTITPQGETVENFNPDDYGFLEEHYDFLHAIETGEEPLSNLLNTRNSLELSLLLEGGFCGPLSEVKQEPSHVDIPKIVPQHQKNKDDAILVLNPQMIREHLPRLESQYRLVFQSDIDKEGTSKLKNVVAIITGMGGEAVREEMLTTAPHMRVVGIVGASVKKYNPEIILNKNIPIINASSAYARTVAEFVVMQAILGWRRASLSHDIMRKGGWGFSSKNIREEMIKSVRKSATKGFLKPLKPLWGPIWGGIKDTSLGKELPKSAISHNFAGLSIGIVGYGEIAKEVISLLKPFNLEVKIFSSFLTEERAEKLGAKKVLLPEAMSSDIVSIHRGLSNRTYHSIGSEELSFLKKGAVFVNTSRGAVVDTDALIERLSKNDVFACLDVFEEEPLSPRSKLRRLKNVFLTSHISGSTTQMLQDAAQTTVDNVLQFLQSGEAENLITTKEKLENMT